MIGQYLGAGSSVTKGLYHFEGNSNDSSGNGNNGTSSNVTYSLANGRFGQGAGFNGTNSQIAIPSGAYSVFNAKNPWTVSMWVNATGFAGGITPKYCLLWSTSNINGSGTQKTAQISLNNNRNVIVTRANGSAETLHYSTGTIVDNVYNLITVTYASDTLSIYINGSYSGGGANTLTATTATYGDFGVWLEASLAYYWLSGSMDELAIYNYAWSAQQVQKYYTYSRGRFATL